MTFILLPTRRKCFCKISHFMWRIMHEFLEWNPSSSESHLSHQTCLSLTHKAFPADKAAGFSSLNVKPAGRGNLAFSLKLHVIIKLHLQNRNCTHYCSLSRFPLPSAVQLMTSHWFWTSCGLLALCGWHWGGCSRWSVIRLSCNGTEWKKTTKDTAHIYFSQDLHPSDIPQTYVKQFVFNSAVEHQ